MNWLKRLSRGFGYLTLDPSPRLRRLREESARISRGPGPLPLLPDSAYPPGAVPLDTSSVPPGYRTHEQREPRSWGGGREHDTSG